MSKLIYLDNSATSFPKPDVVYDFMNHFYRKHGVNPGRSGFDAAVETDEVVNSTRRMLTKLFNGGSDHNRLTFSYNATDSLNLIINGLVEKGCHVVSTMLEHNSVLRPLNMHHQNGVIDEKTDEKLKEILTPEEYNLIMAKNKIKISNFKLKFKIIEVFQAIF